MTLVTARILDPNGNVYANAQVEASFISNIPPGSGTGPPLASGSVFQTFSVSETDSFGNLSMSLTDLATITPSGGSWNFNVLNSGRTIGFSLNTTAITGVTVDISAALQAVAAPLNSQTGNISPTSVTSPKINNTFFVDGIVNTTIQQAINQANAAGGGEVIVPAGTYILTTGVSVPSNIRLRGAGAQKTKLVTSGTAGFDVITNAGGLAGNINIDIMDLSIDATTFTTGSPIGRSIFLQNVVGFSVRNCWLTNNYVHGIRVDSGCDKGWIIGNMIDTVRIGSGIEGGNTPTQSQVTNIMVANNYVANAIADGIFFLGSTNAGAYGTSRISVVNNVCVNNGDTGIEIGQSCQNCNITGNSIIITATGTTGIGIRSTLGVSCSGNSVFGANAATQVGILVWFNAGDNTKSQGNQVTGNIVQNLPIGFKTTGSAGNIDSISLAGNMAFGCATPYNFSGNETNLAMAGNNNKLLSGQIGISAGDALFTPNALFEIQSGSGGGDLRVTQTGDNNTTMTFINTTQRWDWGIRAATSEAMFLRDVTGGSDAFQFFKTGALIMAGALTPSQTGGIIGTTTNNSANAGSVGEFISATLASGSAVALTTTVVANVTSISLTAGDWDVTGVVAFNFGATTSFTDVAGGVSSTSASLGALGSFFDYATAATVPVAGPSPTWTVPVTRLSLSGTTTVFLVARGTFTVSTLSAFGFIRARRVR